MTDSLILDRHAMKDRSTAHLRIYVGGLTEKATVDDLYQHFTQYGVIDGIVINKQFGFVQFRNEASAQQAISKANGSIFQGKNINVKTARSTDDRREQPPALNIEDAVNQTDNSLSVNHNENIPGGNDNEDLYDSFGNFVGDQAYRDEDEVQNKSEAWEERGRGHGRGGRGVRGRGIRGRGSFTDRSPVGNRDRSGGEWNERSNYNHYPQPMTEYARTLPVPERNDCEIIVVAKSLTEYAEYIEGRLKRLGIVVDLLFPMADVPIGKVLGNIASRGCLYAILVMPQNQENRSLTLTMLHGLPQEHRNMPIEDALQLLSCNFQEVRRGGSSGREAVYALLGQLADGRTLTVLQYDKVIEYLQERKEQQVKIELGEPLATAAPSKTHVDLQQRILSILNEKKTLPQHESAAVAAATLTGQAAHNKLLNDPTVKRALDSILQKFT